MHLLATLGSVHNHPLVGLFLPVTKPPAVLSRQHEAESLLLVPIVVVLIQEYNI